MNALIIISMNHPKYEKLQPSKIIEYEKRNFEK